MTTNGSGSNAQIDFTSIPSTYTDLILVGYVNSSAQRNLLLQFNDDTGSNYSRTLLTSDPGSSRTSNATSIVTTGNGVANTTFSTHVIHIMRYADTSVNKTVIIRASNASTGVDMISGLWRSTSAINKISWYTTTANFTTTSTFTLYGIKAA